MNLKNILLINFLIMQSFFSIFPTAQEVKKSDISNDNFFTVEQLKADLLVLRKSLEEGHAGFYRYTPKEEMDKMFTDLENSLIKPITEVEFLLKLKPLIAGIHCGHTGVRLSTDEYSKYNRRPEMIPFGLKFIDKKAYLFYNYSELETLKMGGEVISINERPISEIVESILPLIPNDAHILSSKYRQLERPSNFNQYYSLLFGGSSSYKIKYKSPWEGNETTIDVKGITPLDGSDISVKRYPELSKVFPPISVEYKGNIPVLTIRTFGGSSVYEKKGNSYAEQIKRIFREFKKKNVKNLIIDLRDNGGGNDDYGKILAAYLMDKPFDYYNALEIKKNAFDFFQYTDLPAADRTIPENSVRKNARGWYDYLDHPNVGRQKNLEPTFQGKVYVLINGNSFSTTGECTSVIHYNKKAKFVGEECGAGYYGNNSGMMPQITLPNTKLRITIPLLKYTMAVEGYPADRGIIPDYPVSPKIDDLLKGKDTQMEYLLNLIKNMK
jgi:hypothetical protein